MNRLSSAPLVLALLGPLFSSTSTAASSESMAKVQQAYVSYYGRPGDSAGVDYWAEELDKNGGDMSAIIDAFGNSPEYQERFGALSSSELINNLYQQMFGRDAEQAGLDWWSEQIDIGATTLSQAALQIADGAANEDLTILTNRIDVASTLTFGMDIRDLPYTEDQINAIKAFIQTIDETFSWDSTSFDDMLNTIIESEESGWMVTLSGTVASWKVGALQTDVTGSCSNFYGTQNFTATVDSSGYFSQQVLVNSFPCKLRIYAWDEELFQIVELYGVASEPGTANVNQLTDMVIALASSSLPTDWYALPIADDFSTQIETSANSLISALKATGYQVSNDDLNPTTFVYDFSNGATDPLLDSIYAGIGGDNSNRIDYTNLLTSIKEGNLSAIPNADQNGGDSNGGNGGSGETQTITVTGSDAGQFGGSLSLNDFSFTPGFGSADEFLMALGQDNTVIINSFDIDGQGSAGPKGISMRINDSAGSWLYSAVFCATCDDVVFDPNARTLTFTNATVDPTMGGDANSLSTGTLTLNGTLTWSESDVNRGNIVPAGSL